MEGSDREHAIPVSSIAEEYAWLRRFLPQGHQILSQRLSSYKNSKVDTFQIRLPDGSEREVCFKLQNVQGSPS